MVSRRAIGGEFELRDLRLGRIEEATRFAKGRSGTWTLSGRAALAVVLRHLRSAGISHIHLPSYLCRSVLQPVRATGFEFSFYPLADSLTALPDPPANAAVLLIHYFGWINPATPSLRAVSGSQPLVEDISQALLSDWQAPSETKCHLAMSLRKFGPVPLGGWCSLDVPLGDTSPEAELLVWRSLAGRLARGAYLATPEAAVVPETEDFYLDALRATEEFLDRSSHPTILPPVVMAVAAGLDWEQAAQQRRANWATLKELLPGSVEPLFGTLPEGTVPLGYAVRLPEKYRDPLREQLAARRIFCPVHWPLPEEVSAARFPGAAHLSRTCLTLPVDQRYGSDEMEIVSKAIRAAL